MYLWFIFCKIKNICASPHSRCWGILHDKWKLWPAGGAGGNINGSTRSSELTLWAPWMWAIHFKLLLRYLSRTPVVDWLLTNSSHVSFGFFSYIWLPVTYWTFVCSLLLLEENTRSTSIRVFLCDLFISCLHFNTQRRQPNTNTLWLLAAPNTTTFFSTETRLFRLRDAFSVVITQLGNKQCLPWQ